MFRPPLSLTASAMLCLFSLGAHAASKAQTFERLVPGTLLHVQTDSDAAMKVGAPVRGHLVDPVYVDNQLTIPAGERITGRIVKVVAASASKRRQARWQGDFTPLHEAHIQFDQIVLSDGRRLKLVSKPAKDGVQMLRIEEQSVALHQPSLPKRLWNGLINSEKETLHSFTAPGKIARLKKYVYHQLPYHPESVEAGFDYDVELMKPLQVPVAAASSSEFAQSSENTAGLRESSILHARLENDLSSGSAKAGSPITAIVTQPLYDSQHRLAVPQGTLLLGVVSQASPAAKHGRSGVLRFAFREMQFPAGYVQTVRGATHSVDTNARSNLQLDAEGGVSTRRPNVVKPMVTALLATSAITDDESSVLHAGVASNGFSLIGRIVGIASGSRYVAAGIGAYTTGREVYSRYIATGKDIHFPLNTRIEIAVDPVNSPILKPQ
jgi:hypothetical protein